jgi:hypothetical protein
MRANNMRQPKVRELDLIKAALAVSAVVLEWQECEFNDEPKHLDALENGAHRMLTLVKRFRKEQLT